MEILTKVELTESDALLFIQFQKRFAFMKLLESIGAFDIRLGKLIINFDGMGQITSVDMEKHFKLSTIA